MHGFQSSAKLQRTAGLIHGTIDDEIIILDIDDDSFVHLNRVASRIFEMLERATSFDQLLNELLAEYEVDPGTCEHEVAHVLTEMKERGLVEEVQ